MKTIWHWLFPTICLSIAYVIGIGTGLSLGLKESVKAANEPMAICLMVVLLTVYGMCSEKAIRHTFEERNLRKSVLWFSCAAVVACCALTVIAKFIGRF